MREEELYPYVHDYLEQRFRERLATRHGEFMSISADTSKAHGGSGDGQWSRPDLALAALWRFKYGLSWALDLHSFEVKTESGCDAKSVHETLSHTGHVHYSYLTWHCPNWSESVQAHGSILERCRRFRVGLITFGDPANADSYVVRVPSGRHEPSGEAVDEFIETRFPDEERAKLQEWLERVR